MLAIKDVNFTYRERTKPTLTNINLDVRNGERVLIAGRTGCGKSTLLKVMNGLIPACSKGLFSGKVHVEGMDTLTATPEQIGMAVGTVYQSVDDQLFAMTVEDEVGFALENQGLPDEYVRKAVTEILTEVGLAGLEKRSIHALSGGQRQRLALASVLVCKPKILILDEPASQLNPQGVTALLQFLLRLNTEYGITLIVVEHRLHELYSFFPRLVVLHEGQIAYDGDTKRVWGFAENKPEYGLREPQCIRAGRLLGIHPPQADCLCLAGAIQDKYKLRTVRQKGNTEPIAVHNGGTVVVADKLTFGYQGYKEMVLKDLDFTVYRGEVIAVMGNNGAGKSTLLNILCGLLQPVSGSVKLFGGSIKDNSCKIGFLRQEPDLMLLCQTVKEEIIWNRGGKITLAELDALVRRLVLQEHLNDFPQALSKGQRLRVVLAALLALKPEMLLLDEPTTGQDYQSMLDIQHVIERFIQTGGTVLFCTHDVEMAAELADRVFLFDRGNVLASGNPREIFANAELVTRCGLTVPPVLMVADKLGIAKAITVKELVAGVNAADMGRV